MSNTAIFWTGWAFGFVPATVGYLSGPLLVKLYLRWKYLPSLRKESITCIHSYRVTCHDAEGNELGANEKLTITTGKGPSQDFADFAKRSLFVEPSHPSRPITQEEKK